MNFDGKNVCTFSWEHGIKFDDEQHENWTKDRLMAPV